MNEFTHYISILEKHGINNAKKIVGDMVLIDYLLMNFDRHMYNFGIIRNVESLKWERVAPIFDTGESMNCDKILNEMNFKNGYGKFFGNTHKRFSDIIRYVDLSNYDFGKIKGIPEKYQEILKKYQAYTEISDERIEKLVQGLEYRIDKTIKMQNK